VSLPRVASLLIAGSACCSAGVAKSKVVMVRDRSVGVVDVDVVRDRLAGVVVLEPVVVDDRLAAVYVSIRMYRSILDRLQQSWEYH